MLFYCIKYKYDLGHIFGFDLVLPLTNQKSVLNNINYSENH